MMLWLVIILGALLVGGALTMPQVRELLVAKTTPAGTAVPVALGGSPEGPGKADSSAVEDAPFGYEDVAEVVGVLGAEERARVLADEAAFAQLVGREGTRRSVIRAARKAGLGSNPQVEVLMRRSADQVLFDTYVRLKAGSVVKADFPTDAQVRDFYEKNKAQFQIDARIPVWQIFLSIPKEADEAKIAETERAANDLVKSLRAGKLTFAQAADEHSDNEASRLNGGLMGNLKVSELIPEVKSTVLALKPGEISAPVRSQAGIHIMKRGERIEAKALPLEQVYDGIRKSLRQAAATRARQMVVSQAQAAFEDAPSGEDIEKWRETLVETHNKPAQ
jgi:peptidylprolyl isomerase